MKRQLQDTSGAGAPALELQDEGQLLGEDSLRLVCLNLLIRPVHESDQRIEHHRRHEQHELATTTAIRAQKQVS